VPVEFTRLRYAYGLRLGAVELSDEQGYLVGKHRFHNVRCHGAGVLCGLRVDRFVWPQGPTAPATATVLRVTTGAAMDQCGREILVPCDQCVDVAAWFANHRAKLNLAAATATLPLRVALRYRECPSDPAPVPRDPCGCDAAGCDYSRVHEGFELALFGGTFPACVGEIFPNINQLVTALNGGPTATAGSGSSASSGTSGSSGSTASTSISSHDLASALNAVLAAGCPKAAPDAWICLADFTATITWDASGTTPSVTDISAPDNQIPGRYPLLSTAALQTLLLGVAGAAGAEGMLGIGPMFGQASFTGSGTDSGTLKIPVNLITDPNQAQPTPLTAATFLPAYVAVDQFDKTNGWKAVTPAAGSIQWDGSNVTVTWSSGSGLSPGNYRVSVTSPDDQPIVDQRMRPLRPGHFALNFGLAADAANGNNLIWAPLSL
jgi:hypothetical protein